MYKKKVTINFREGFRHPAVKKIGILLIPRAFGSAIYQVNIFVDTMLASLSWIVGAGGVAALYYANRLIQFPLAMFGLALAQAALPKMSQEFLMKDTPALKYTLSFSLRATFLVMIPASVGLAMLGVPIIKILFQRGEFTSYSTDITQSALFFYAFGLCAYGGTKLLVACFYAMQDTITPVRSALVAVILNVILSLIFMWPLKLGGLALATSISATFNFVNLYIILQRKIGHLGSKEILNSFLKILSASVIMGVVLKFISAYAFSVEGLLISIAIGGLTFAIAAYILKVKELTGALGWILKKQ